MQFLALCATVALGASMGVAMRALVSPIADVSSDRSFGYISGEIQRIDIGTGELTLIADAPVISSAPSLTTLHFDSRASWYSASNVRESGVITRNMILPIRPENVRPGDRVGIVLLRTPNGMMYPELLTTARMN